MKKGKDLRCVILLAVVFTLSMGIGSLKAEGREKRRMEAIKGQRVDNLDTSNLPPELRKFYSPRVEQKENKIQGKPKSPVSSGRRTPFDRAKFMQKLETVEKAPKRMIDASAEIDVSETLRRKSLVEVKTFEPAKEMQALSGKMSEFQPQKVKEINAGSVSRINASRRLNQADIKAPQPLLP